MKPSRPHSVLRYVPRVLYTSSQMRTNLVQGCYFRTFSGGSFGLQLPNLPLAPLTASCWPHWPCTIFVRSNGLKITQLVWPGHWSAGTPWEPRQGWARQMLRRCCGLGGLFTKDNWGKPEQGRAKLVGFCSQTDRQTWRKKTTPASSHFVPPKPGLMLKSWSSIRRSCSDFVSGDLVMSGLRFRIGLPRGKNWLIMYSN